MNNDLNMDKIDDTISRHAAIDAVNYVMVMKGIRSEKSVAAEAVESTKSIIADNIRQLPSIQPERIKAKWLPIGIADAVGGESAMWGDEIAYHVCDNCWQQALEKDGEEVLSNFCPHCGADMRGEQE